MRVPRFLLVALVLLPAPAVAQERMGAHPWGPWGPTYWNTLEARVKCEGTLPFGQSTRWRVSLRNVGDQRVYLDYVVTFNGNRARESKPRRISIDPGKMKEAVEELRTDCGSLILTRISNVRLGGDTDDIPYSPPDAPRSRIGGDG